MQNSQRGVTLIITFLIMTVMLAIALNVSLLFFGEVKIVGDVGNSVTAFYAADSGLEQVTYLDRKAGGFCNICDNPAYGVMATCNSTSCVPEGPNGGCYSELQPGGCSPTSCNNCRLQFYSTIDGKTYHIDAEVYPVGASTVLDLQAKGVYQNITRAFDVNYAH